MKGHTYNLRQDLLHLASASHFDDKCIHIHYVSQMHQQLVNHFGHSVAKIENPTKTLGFSSLKWMYISDKLKSNKRF